MRTPVWFLFSFGIPLVGVIICVVGGRALFRLARQHRIGKRTAILLYIGATAIPFGLALLAMQLGSYLGNTHRNYVYYGEATWMLFITMGLYLVFSAIANIILFIAVARQK